MRWNLEKFHIFAIIYSKLIFYIPHFSFQDLPKILNYFSKNFKSSLSCQKPAKVASQNPPNFPPIISRRNKIRIYNVSFSLCLCKVTFLSNNERKIMYAFASSSSHFCSLVLTVREKEEKKQRISSTHTLSFPIF